MSTILGLRGICVTLAALVIAVFVAPAAQATAITYNFTVDVTSGPLSGVHENGSFTYDSSSVILSNMNDAQGLLTALVFTFNGINLNAGTANTGYLVFDSAGNLSGFTFGSGCTTTCHVYPGTDSWIATGIDFGAAVGGFAYTTPAMIDDYGLGDVTYALAPDVGPGPPTSVPEPSTLGLFGLGALMIGLFVGRRRRIS